MAKRPDSVEAFLGGKRFAIAGVSHVWFHRSFGRGSVSTPSTPRS